VLDLFVWLEISGSGQGRNAAWRTGNTTLRFIIHCSSLQSLVISCRKMLTAMVWSNQSCSVFF